MRVHHRKHKPLAEFPGTTRIEAFSDGVIAIIITIMVLELHVPQLAESFSREDFLKAMEHFWPKLLVYAMSFVIVGIFWVNHHGFFHYLKKSDGKLLWYNNFLLFWMSLIPIGTAFLGEHPTSVEAIMAFGSILTLASFWFPIMAGYAMFRSDLFHDHISMETRRAGQRRNWPGCILYLLSVLLAPVSIWISWGIFFIVPLYYFVPYRIGDEIFE